MKHYKKDLLKGFEKQEWENSWGLNTPTIGVNNSEFFKIAEIKLKSTKINNIVEDVKYGANYRTSRLRRILQTKKQKF